MLERSSWREQPLSSRSLTREESKNACKYNNKTVTNGWQYDDVCRDKLDMNTGNLGHVTIIDSIDDANTQEIIKGLKGEASSKKLADGRYIFVLRKYANDPDKLGLVLRRYDRNVIQPTGQVCKNDKYSYADNIRKTVSKGNPGHVRHSQLNGGWNPVYSAGELWVKNGQIIVVSNESGHFKPTKASLDAVKETLDYLSVPTQNIHFYDFEKDKEALETYKKQCGRRKNTGLGRVPLSTRSLPFIFPLSSKRQTGMVCLFFAVCHCTQNPFHHRIARAIRLCFKKSVIIQYDSTQNHYQTSSKNGHETA